MAFSTLYETSGDVDGLRSGSVFAKSRLCGSEFVVFCGFRPGLGRPGQNVARCGQEGDGSVHLWVCGAALAFVDLYCCGQFPSFGDIPCEEEGVE